MSGEAPRPILHVLTGCTAVGKTEWALRWAEAHRAEILSCDSLLFYRGMDVGTAKPTAQERARIVHHLVDLCDPDQPMNVSRYAALALETARAVRERGRAILVTGGSGFYLKSFYEAVSDGIETPQAVRDRVAALEGQGGLGALLPELRRLNPAGLGPLDVSNPRRVVRALERCLASGRTLAEQAEAFARLQPPFSGWEIRTVRLDRGTGDLVGRITRRVRAMLDAGLVAEVEGLLAAGALQSNPSAMRAIGYREVVAVLEGRLARPALEAEIIRNTRALVKKQRTWFRTQLPAHRVLDAGALAHTDALFGD